MRRTLGTSAVALATSLLLACAPATQRAFVAPSYQSIVRTTEEREGPPPTHVIYVENHSTVPVKIFAYTLTDCENVNVECGVHRANIHLDADQRVMVVRIEPKVRTLGFRYSFGFSWQDDSSRTTALNALAAAGDSSARVRLAAMQHSDSLQRAQTGTHYNELSRTDFPLIASRVASMRADPESLLIVPGERTSIERIRLLLVEKDGVVLGQTRWVGWRIESGAVQFEPPTTLIARRPGRTKIRFHLADEPEKMIGSPVNEVEYSVVAAYPVDAHAPMFDGRALDGESRKPLACASVALEDSAQNVVARERTGAEGTFVLNAPRPGTYRVRVETPGWAPVYGPTELAKADEEKQHEYLVKFSEQMLTARYLRETMSGDGEHARPISVRIDPTGGDARGAKNHAAAPIAQGVTLGGSEAMPILGIVGRAPSGTSWMQFVVDSTGRVDTGSISLPADTSSKRLASVTSVLPRVRFSPAREAGKPVCELLRMQVNFSAR